MATPAGSHTDPATDSSQPTITLQNQADPASLPPDAIDLATKLFNAARKGDTDTLNRYITAGIPPNLTNTSGDTLLMLASYHGHAATVRMLLACGADPDTLNDRGQSPLAGAVFKGYSDVVQVLAVEGKADLYKGQPNAVDTAGMFKRADLLDWMGVNVHTNEAPPSTT